MLKRLWDRALLVLLRVLIVSIISLRAFFTRQRMSHQNGILAAGTLEIVDHPGLPENGFFVPGRRFDCRLRHASVRLLDDAALVVRGASLKFADANYASPLDLLMNTGQTAPFWNMWTFFTFMLAVIRGARAKLIPFYQANTRCLANVVVALRRPTTFAQLHYHSQTPFEFRAFDDRLRYIRFRLMPADRGPETGYPDAEDLRMPWFQDVKRHEAPSPNYLKEEYKSRVQAGPVTYHLQTQLHEWQDGDHREVILNSLYPWEEATHPWNDLATVTVDRIRAADERGDHTLFTITNHPECIRLIKPLSIHDPPSLEYLRVGGMWERRIRLLAIRLFGPASPIPSTRPEPKYPDEAGAVITVDDLYMAASLPQSDPPARQRERRRQLDVARGLYQFEEKRGFPPSVRTLPPAEEFTGAKRRRIDWYGLAALVDLRLAAFRRLFRAHRGLAAYDDFYPLLPEPSVSRRFKDDREFGRQRLNGVNPHTIRRCEAMPPGFAVDDRTVADLLEGQTLAQAMAARRLYLVDYGILAGIPIVPGRHVAAPFCLLYVDHQGDLRPVAIQLGRSAADGPVFTPNDEFWLWQTAKTHFQCADAQFHEAVSHLLRTHLVMEVFAVAMHRSLSPAHPVHQLLAPHFRFTMAINHFARTSLIAPDGAIDKTFAVGAAGALELLSKVWETDWSFEQYDLAADLARRGVDDPGRLPNFHYRDDALKLWSAIEEFVTAVVRTFYASDRDVVEDDELQEWLRELVAPEGGQLRGVPARLDSSQGLVTLVTSVLFTASAGHAAANNGQYEMYGYIPNAPGAMYRPPPATRDALTEADLVAALPRGQAIDEQILLVRLLSEPTQAPLGTYDANFFAGRPEVEPLVKRFQRRLHAIGEDIDARNVKLAVPYTSLHPKSIYPSVEI
jgi:arachidonate 5-lipoxygenase